MSKLGISKEKALALISKKEKPKAKKGHSVKEVRKSLYGKEK